MADDRPLDDTELDQISFNLERGLCGPWELRRLIFACRTQRRVLRTLFGLFQKDAYGLRSQSDSLRSDNLDALKRDVAMEDPS